MFCSLEDYHEHLMRMDEGRAGGDSRHNAIRRSFTYRLEEDGPTYQANLAPLPSGVTAKDVFLYTMTFMDNVQKSGVEEYEHAYFKLYPRIMGTYTADKWRRHYNAIAVGTPLSEATFKQLVA